jgi:phosphoglycerate dehydrogenase-like enzyme
MSRPIVIVTEGLDARPLQWLKERADVREIEPDSPAFVPALADASALVVRTYTKVNAELLSKAPNLRAVGRGGVGIENIDVGACRRRGVQVVYTPDANTLAVGDYVFSLVLQLIRPYGFFRDHAYDAKTFKRIRNEQRGRQLNELTIGIIGMGRVGRRVGTIARNGFGMRVIYNDLVDVSSQLQFDATSKTKEELLAEADVVTLHVDMRPGNENLIGRHQLLEMKSDAILVNTSRGEVLDAAALAEVMRGGRLHGAALDVYAPEPPPPDFPLLGLPNVLLAPHMAARTETALENMSWVVRDVVAVLEGRPPKCPAP